MDTEKNPSYPSDVPGYPRTDEVIEELKKEQGEHRHKTSKEQVGWTNEESHLYAHDEKKRSELDKELNEKRPQMVKYKETTYKTNE